MSAKFFLDTNIFVYSFDDSSPRKRARAQDLIDQALKSGLGVISHQVVQEFLNVALTRFATPLSLQDAQVYLSLCLRPLCRVTSSIEQIDSALVLRDRYKLSFYDSLMVTAAMQADCGVLYSEDLPPGLIIEGMKIENPFAGKAAA